MSEPTDLGTLRRGTELVKRGFAQMQKGGVIMDVVTREQARIAEDAGAVAVMALEAVPADIRKRGGVARMPDPSNVTEIIDEVSIPVMGKSRIGHHTEAQILEALGVDMIDESEVLTPADDEYHIDKRDFTSPFVCGARNLPEALRRIHEGAAMIRTKGEAGTGDVNQAVQHQRTMMNQIRTIEGLDHEEREKWAREHGAPRELVHETAEMGRLPVVNFAAGGIAKASRTNRFRTRNVCRVAASNRIAAVFKRASRRGSRVSGRRGPRRLHLQTHRASRSPPRAAGRPDRPRAARAPRR